MRQEDVANREAVLVDRREQQIDVVSGVDDHALPCFLAADDKPVLHERRDRPCLENHVSLLNLLILALRGMGTNMQKPR